MFPPSLPSPLLLIPAAQGLGKEARDSFLGHTNLTETYARRVPSYGGHVPAFAAADSGIVNKARGVEGGTEYDRSTGAVETYWASLKRGN